MHIKNQLFLYKVAICTTEIQNLNQYYQHFETGSIIGVYI